MPIYTELPASVNEVDVIVAGGGTAGCVLASRLAEASRDLSILIIEQGPSNYNVPESVHPALFPRNLHPNSHLTLFWRGNKSEHLAGRSPVVPSGGTLGGGSSINWMVYTRGSRSDFDGFDAEGWNADELLPYLNKFETYHGRGQREHHGHSGPIHVSKGTFTAKRSEDDFIKAASELSYSEIVDAQNLSLESGNATERWSRYVGKDGKRQDAAHRFLHPKLQEDGGKAYPNLHVLVESQVVRVLIEGQGPEKKAVGVEYQRNPKTDWAAFQTGNLGTTTVKARKLVVLSSGANGTPLMLERSGVGNPSILKRAGVPVVEELPGVGENYQDHHLTLYAYRTSLSDRETINGFADGRFDVRDLISKNDSLLSWNSMDASGKFRPTDEEAATLGPAFKEAWDRDFKDAKDRPLMIVALYNSFFGDHRTLPDTNEYVSMANWTAYPYSRGHHHITGRELSDKPDFDVGYLGDKGDVDLKKHLWAYKLQREIFRRMSIFRGEHAGSHPSFPSGSAAAIVEKADGPLAKGPEDRIKYTAEDDAAIEKKIREIVSTTWHSLGTCKLAPREKGGVVDKDLSVYGVKGLKVADLSVPPVNVGANTNNTALMIGEKAADIFVKELGLTGKAGVVEQARL